MERSAVGLTNTTVASSTPITFEHWIALTRNTSAAGGGITSAAGDLHSKNAYIESAVDLAWIIAKHLSRILLSVSEVARLEETVAPKNALDELIAPRNIIIYVQQRPLTSTTSSMLLLGGSSSSSSSSSSSRRHRQHDRAQHHQDNVSYFRNPSIITGVRFQFESLSPSPSSTSASGHVLHTLVTSGAATAGDATDRSGNALPLSRLACVALGKILLEIFTMGESNDILKTISSSSSITDKTKNLHLANNYDDDDDGDAVLLPPNQKRRASLPTNGNSNTKSTKAKNLLISLGMPLSICQLVCDLLHVENYTNRSPSNFNNSPPSSNNSNFTSLLTSLLEYDGTNEDVLVCPTVAITSVEDALWDLTNMKAAPRKFLFDRTCPQKALDDAYLLVKNMDDARLIGRERERRMLTILRNKVASHVRRSNCHNINNNNNNSSYHTTIANNNKTNFLCEATFLSGYAGSGKSSLLHSLTRACREDKWFVLQCKFDERAAPHAVLAGAFDAFFGRWGASKNRNNDNGSITDRSGDDRHCNDESMMQSFNRVCRHIFATLDDGGLGQLCDLVPNFAVAFPLLSLRVRNADNPFRDGISSMEKVGSAAKRLRNLFHVLFESLCLAGRPVLLALDDLQWSSKSSVMEDVADFVVNYVYDASRVSPGSLLCRRGLLIAGTFRNNEVKEGDHLIKHINSMKESGRANITMLNIEKLSEFEVAKLVSEKLCLPLRYTQKLSNLVHGKTRGNPFFVIQFLRSIVQNNMMWFSVKYRRWMWDCDTVDVQMISDGVAELLTTTFNRLSPTLMLTLKIVSCLGSQVEESTIDVLDSRNEVLSFDMKNELPRAIKEGIMEKAGPVYQFTHDIVYQTIYDLIPSDNRNLLHKTIGKNLLKSVVANNPTILLLAVDQINLFCKGGNPTDPEECSFFADSNVTAAKIAISASSLVQARSYIDTGIQLLREDHWQTQYSLSLDLFEMSASVSCMLGDIDKMPNVLDEILSNSKSFDDNLKASSFVVKLLASSSKFNEARSNCLAILSNLGELFPEDVSLPVVLEQLSLTTRATLRNITRNQIKMLPPMTNRNKLNAMKFLNMLCMYSNISKPMMLPLLSCRMVQLTMEYGFCDDSIVGLATAGYSVFNYTDDIQLASQMGKLSESLIEESPKKHVLRSRLCNELVSLLKSIAEPIHSVLPLYPELYNSAMQVGDVENAMICRWSYIAASLWIGATDLYSVSKHLVLCIKEATKYQQDTVLKSAMVNLNACAYLSGRPVTEISVKSYDELIDIGMKTNSAFLLGQIFMHRLALHFWMREYTEVAELSEKHAEMNPSFSQQRRILNIYRTLFEGIVYLTLARDTKQTKWKVLGKKAVNWMSQLESMSAWNYENKSILLQAEFHYLEGDLESAESAYQASIKSAHVHKFIPEEALACELYGVFCVETQMIDKGHIQLHLALEKYRLWGATNKANQLQLFIDLVEPRYLHKLKLLED